MNNNAGAANIIINGDVTNAVGAGVFIGNQGASTTIVNVTTGTTSHISAKYYGIQAFNYGTGATNITLHGDVSAASTGKIYGVIDVDNFSHIGATNINIDGGHVSATGTFSRGITAYNKYGTGTNISISNGGSVISASTPAISTGSYFKPSTSTPLNITLDGSSSAVTITGGGGTAIAFGNVTNSVAISGTANINGNVVGGSGVDTLNIGTATLNMGTGSVFSGFEVANITGVLTTSAGKIVSIGSTTPIAVNGGTLNIGVTGSTSFGKIIGSSGITFSNGGKITVDATGIGAITDHTTLTNVFSGGTVTGLTAGLLTSNSTSYTFTSIVNANSIDVLVGVASGGGGDGGGGSGSSTTLASAASSSNGSAVGAALDAINTANNGGAALKSLITTINNFSTTTQKNAAIKTLAPDISGSSVYAAVAVSDVAIGTVENHMETAMNEASGSGIATGGKTNDHGVWGQLFGKNITQGFRKGVDGYDADVGGFAVGTDGDISRNFKVGAALSYAYTRAKGTNSETIIETPQVSIYATYEPGKIYYEGLGSVAISQYSGTRTLFDGTVASSDYNGYQYSAKGTVGYRTNIGSLNFIPFGSLQYSYMPSQKYTETGSSAPLQNSNNDFQVFKSGVGAKFSRVFSDNGFTYSPHVSAAWYFDFINDTLVSDSNFSAAPAVLFTSRGATPERSSFKLGTGLDVLSMDKLTVSIDYNVEARETYRAHTGELKARLEF